ncbi:E3 ubiquitin-protein ligase TRIM39 [Antennarius striatus]|uniref:E3 ubiquitin-protein ligase TRIM39 n=1 Tax=Antennarius striatus TaxID=241820 RepID=UPI0035B1D7A9
MSMSESEANVSEKARSDALALELTCPICLELFSQPVSIPCGHIYCFGCLQTMGEDLDHHNCPECQAEYQTDGLVKNFKMCSIIETYKATAGKANAAAELTNIDHQSDKRDNRIGPEQRNTECCQDVATAGESESTLSFNQEQDKDSAEMEGYKFKLTSQMAELGFGLELAESVLRKEKERDSEMAAVNGQLRQKALKLLGQVEHLSQLYSQQVMQLIEEDLGLDEAHQGRRVSQASELTEQLRQATLRAESLLTKVHLPDFKDEFLTLQPHIIELLAKPVQGEGDPIKSNPNHTQACSKLEDMNAELRKAFGEVQRCLRNTLNPSEVTFDPETAHPNLILSEDLKTVTFSSSKQPYPPSAQRFTSFLQVLSTQSFFEGEHRWEVELEGSPWIIGVCYSGKLARSGVPSALESSRSSWCLMWFNNLLTAYEQSYSVPLKKTTMSRRLEIRLSFKTNRLSFYNISTISGKTHVYTFKAVLTEPVHLAYRMISGHPDARVTFYS